MVIKPWTASVCTGVHYLLSSITSASDGSIRTAILIWRLGCVYVEKGVCNFECVQAGLRITHADLLQFRHRLEDKHEVCVEERGGGGGLFAPHRVIHNLGPDNCDCVIISTR